MTPVQESSSENEGKWAAATRQHSGNCCIMTTCL